MKLFLSLAAAVVVLAACENTGPFTKQDVCVLTQTVEARALAAQMSVEEYVDAFNVNVCPLFEVEVE